MIDFLTTPVPLWALLLSVGALSGVAAFFRWHSDKMYEEARRYADEARMLELHNRL